MNVAPDLLTKLKQWNATDRPYPQDRCIHQLFEDQIAKTPDAPAVIFEEQRLTYAQLNAKANQLAHFLREHGVGPAVPVGICMDRSLEMVVALLAILKAGAAYVPLDPLYPPERLQFMLDDVGVRLVVTTTGLQTIFPTSVKQIDPTQTADILSYPTSNPSYAGKAGDLACIIFTSGSTGIPKGVAVPHRGAARLLFGQDFMQFGPNLTMLQLAPVSFDASTLEIWGPLLHGGRCVLYPGRVLDFARLEDELRSQHINALLLTTTLFNTIISARPQILATVSTILIGGEALSVSHIRTALAILPNVNLINAYGPTECTTITCCYQIPNTIEETASSIPIGKPIGNTWVYVLDANRYPVPIGTSGELYIGGAGLARGYVNRPEFTAERFISDLFSDDPAGRLYKTGDICRYLEDGNIEYLGRADDQVKIRGFRIELGEIESVFLSHPAVKQAVVLAREDQPGEKVLTAYVVAKKPGITDEQELRQHLAVKLPEYMIPAVFMEIETVPLTTSGKTDRKALPQPSKTASLQRSNTAPQTAIQQSLADIWQKILGVTSISLEDHFFELGGHSLKAIQAIYQVQSRFDLHIPVSCLFEHPTLQDFSQAVDSLRTQEAHRAITIPRASRDLPLPQSFAQQQLWFIEQLALGLPVYNISFLLHMEGELNVPALASSLETLIDRHEAFRTTFQLTEGKAVQVIHSDTVWQLQIINIALANGTTPEDEFAKIAKVQAKKLFDLEKGPLFEFHLLKADANHHALVLNMHHLITDGWSMGVITKELSELYNAHIQERKPRLAELPIQNADFGLWQRQQLQFLLDRSLSYWQETLAGELPEVTLPGDHPRPAVQTFNGAWLYHSINPALYARLLVLSRKQHVTLNMTLMAAFKVLLYRVLRIEDIIIGSPISGRIHPQIENLIGFFVNTVVLQTKLHGNPTFLESLERMNYTSRKAQEHQDLPYEVVVEKLNPQRDPSRNLYFQIMFAYQDARYWQPKLSGLHVQGVDIGTDTAKVDLTMFAEENDQGLLFRAEYNSDLYDKATIRRFLAMFEHVLDSIVMDPHQRINEIALLTDVDRQAIAQWNATEQPYPQDRCIHQLFEDQVTKTPDAPAVIFEEQGLTYSQLNAKANQLAHFLRAHGAGSDVPVGLCMDRSLEMVVALLAILKAGAAYVPLDPLYPPERLQFMVGDIGVRLLVADAGLQTIFPAFVKQFDPAQKADILSYPKNNPSCAGKAEDLAYIIFTSGSTGVPKGVAVPHRGAVRLLFGQDFMQFGTNLTMLQLAPVSFDASTLEIWGPLLHGGQCVLYPGRVPDFSKLEEVLRGQHINALWLTASIFNIIIDTRPQILETVDTILTGGEALSVSHIHKALAVLPNVQLVNGYGPTESTTFTCCYRIPHTIEETICSIPIGKPIGNTQVYILDANRYPVPVGFSGELYIGGAGLARGYVNRPELTAEQFIPDPFSNDPTGRLYKTGDICRYLEDGNIEYLGRTDDQVKIRGLRIELGEIESALRSHPTVKQAVVLAREDQPGQKNLAAYVVLGKSGEIDSDGLQQWLAQKLPTYMVPSTIMELPSLPLAASGKTDRKALPRPPLNEERTESSIPQTTTETLLAAIWQQLLKLEAINRGDHFFRLGGHSLLAAELFFRIRESFAVQLPLHTIFQAPTLMQLAEVIDTTTWEMTTNDMVLIKPGSGPHPIFYLPGIGGHTLSFYYLAEAMHIDHPQYGLNLVGLDGRAEPQERIEDMATHFISLILTVQPHGPYNLCGYSFGGRVAFEMALQLQAAGETISFLGLLGSTAPGYPPTAENRWLRIAYRFYDFLSIGPVKQFRYLRYKIGKEMSRKHQRAEARYVSDQQHVVNAAMRAWYRYDPKECFKGNLEVINESRTSSDLYARYNDPQYGWGKYVNGSVNSHAIDCNHLDLFNGPHVFSLGERIEHCLHKSVERKSC